MIIVDANVLSAAGNKSHYPASVNSRNILNHIDGTANLHIRVCGRLSYEYKAHWSAIGRTWYAKMLRRGRVRHVKTSTTSLDARIDGIATMGPRQKIEAKKDSHLIVLSEGFYNIISNEVKSKNIYLKFKKDIPEIDLISWESPSLEYSIDNGISWNPSAVEAV